MPSQHRPVLAFVIAVVVLAVAGAWWSGWFAPEAAVAPAVPDSSPPSANVQVQSGPGAAVAPTDAKREGDRTAAMSTAVADVGGTGSLLLQVVWGDDKQPAVDLLVSLWRAGQDDLFDTRKGTTDAAGKVLFEHLAPGNVFPSPGRGRAAEHCKVAIVAGQRADATLALKVGMRLRGRVVDAAGAPVADAEVLHAGWGGGESIVLASTGPDGTFALRGIDTHSHIGARKAGWRPSSMRQFTTSDGADVECTIVLEGNGGALAGRVLGPSGAPVAGAVVVAGDDEQKNHRLPDGGQAMGPQPERVRTDADGRFRVASLVPGKTPVLVRARGLAPWLQTIDVAAGRTEELTVHLQPGVVVHGTVRDAAGAAVARADVVVELDRTLGWRSTETAADGTFRIEGLPVGELTLRAERDKVGKMKATLAATVGQVVRWDPVLSAGLQLRGRVVDAAGKPLRDVTVEGQLERPGRGAQWWAHEGTDADGRFVLDNCVADRMVRLSFRRLSTFPELVLRDVVPTAEELVVSLKDAGWVHIRGAVRGPDGEVVGNVRVQPNKKDSFSGTPAETVDAATGALQLGPYPPGVYTLRVEVDGFPALLFERECKGGETWDLGEVRFAAGGTLVVQPIAATPVEGLRVAVRSSGKWLQDLQRDGDLFRSGPLPAGAFELGVTGKGIASQAVPCEVRVGIETRLDVPLVAGVAVTFTIVVPAGTSLRSFPVVVRSSGAVAWRGSAWNGESEVTAATTLAPGTYSVEVGEGALQGAAEFTVAQQAVVVSVPLMAK